MTHTPGPWAIAYPIIFSTALGERQGRVAAVSIGYKDTATFEANARLIAAAPCLLEALEKVLREFDHEDRTPDQTDALYAANAAIAKAKGDRT